MTHCKDREGLTQARVWGQVPKSQPDVERVYDLAEGERRGKGASSVPPWSLARMI